MKERITFLMAALCLMSINASSQNIALSMNIHNHVITSFVPATFDSYIEGELGVQDMEYSNFSIGIKKNKRSAVNELHSITSVFPDPVGNGQQLFIPTDHLAGATRMEMITIYGELVQTLNPDESAVTMPTNLEHDTYFISVYRDDVINNFMITVD